MRLFLLLLVAWSSALGQTVNNFTGSGAPTDPSGFMVNDALRLKRLIDSGDALAAYEFSEKVKKQYVINSSTIFFAAFPTPPAAFLAADITTAQSNAKAFTTKNILSAAAGLDVTTLADGAARFLVRRTKQELNAAFFNKLRQTLRQEKYKDFRLLFPQTHQALELIGTDIYDYQKYLNTLRTTFQKDLATLPPHLTRWVDEGSLQTYFTRKPHLKAGLRSSLYFYNELANGTHPGKAIEQFPVSYLTGLTFNGNNPNPLKADALSQALITLSKSLRSADHTRRYWVSADSVRLLVNDARAWKFYWAMLYATLRASPIQVVTGGSSLDGMVANWETKGYISKISDFIEQTSQTEDALRQARSREGRDSVAYEHYFRFFEQFVQTAHGGYKLVHRLATGNDVPPDSRTGLVFGLLEEVAELGLDVNHRKYSAAVAHAAAIYNRLTSQATSETVTIDGRTVKVVDHRNDVIPQFLRYGNFIAAVGEAKTSDEVAAAIEVFALPAGSSSVKRESIFNVSLNAFTGLLAGREIIPGVQTERGFNTTAISAPIGIAASLGRIRLRGKSQGNTLGHNSLSLFIPLIDLGAVTAFRFTNDSTASLPQIKLGTLFAPGVALSIGFGRTPISLTGGWQIGPLLRKVEVQNNAVNDKKYTRWFISANVDIPLLNFYNKR